MMILYQLNSYTWKDWDYKKLKITGAIDWIERRCSNDPENVFSTTTTKKQDLTTYSAMLVLLDRNLPGEL
jgi:hypothetical protein